MPRDQLVMEEPTCAPIGATDARKERGIGREKEREIEGEKEGRKTGKEDEREEEQRGFPTIPQPQIP